MAKKPDPPIVLIKWYDFTKWLLDRVDNFPKNQRFMFGQRVTDHAVDRRKKGSGLFLWSSSWASCGFEPKSNGTSSGPVVITKRQAAFDTAAK